MQKTAYELRISDWSSDVCSSDLLTNAPHADNAQHLAANPVAQHARGTPSRPLSAANQLLAFGKATRHGKDQRHGHVRRVFGQDARRIRHHDILRACGLQVDRSEEHTSELQSLMRISYAVFCLKKKIQNNHNREL